MSKKITQLSLVAFATSLLPSLSWAHTGHPEHGFIAGFSHPLMGWDHLLAMLAVGILAASVQGNDRWKLPSVFVGTMAAGITLGTLGIYSSLIEWGILASVLLIPALCLMRVNQLGSGAITFLIAAFGLCHGMAHGAELGSQMDVNAIAGILLATTLLHSLGMLLKFASLRVLKLHA